ITDDKHEPLAVHASATLTPAAGETIPRADAKRLEVAQLQTAPRRKHVAKGSTDPLLTAAVTRTLGGADVLASPRAAGQLDALLQSKDLDADRLALAAWVSPSGANRSSRLYRALTRAKKANDTATTGFVDRR